MEPRSIISFYDAASDRITLRMSSQMPSGVRDSLCDEVLGLPHDKVRVLVGDVGGGFGMKTGIYPEDIVLAVAARQVKRPVHWAAERLEEFLSATHGRDVESVASLALDASGRVLAFRVNSQANVGAYGTTVGIIIQLMIGPWVSTSIYDIKTIDFTLQAVLTNTAPTGAYRGAGRPEAIYIIERLMDAAARKLKLDPTEIRRRNMIRPEQMPYTNAMGQVYDSGKFESVMDQALKLADWQGFAARAEASRKRGKLRGRGIATFLEWTGGNVLEERVTVAVRGDGEIEIYSATQAMGQGIATSYRPARRRRVRRSHRQDPHRPGRHRSRLGLRQRRLALALHRRLGHSRRLGKGHDHGARPRLVGARGVGRGHRICRGRVPGLRHRPQGRAVRSRRAPAGAADLHRFHQLRRRSDLAQWLPYLRGRDRSRYRRRRCRRLRLGQRCRPRGEPDDRPRSIGWRRGAGSRPGLH